MPRVLLLLCSALIALIAAEVVLRFVPPDLSQMRGLLRAAPDARGYELVPSTRLEFRGMFSRLPDPVVWQVNAQGLRAEANYGAPSERFRIGAYGDSETFGVSVALEDTYPEQMEALDGRVEALNFGVPGYNVTNIATQLERTLPRFRPDLAIYLVHNNDTDDPLTLSRFVADSALLLRLRFLYQLTLAKPAREARRHSRERARVFAAEVDRMERFCQARGVPLLLAFLKWEKQRALVDYARSGGRWELNVQPATWDRPRLDDHLTGEGYAAIARMLCDAIAGAPGAGCVPPGWLRRPRGPLLHAAGGESLPPGVAHAP